MSLKTIRDSQFYDPIYLTLSCCMCGGKIGLTIIGSEKYYHTPHFTHKGYLWCDKCFSLPKYKRIKREKELIKRDIEVEKEVKKLRKLKKERR